mmetsp:Transcript_23829/g.49581  ORF Transcript_23829/g.49581 Transcript_23829/m.49581 type:complete len:236 (-) Transcript_23829:1101-1808(-)
MRPGGGGGPPAVRAPAPAQSPLPPLLRVRYRLARGIHALQHPLEATFGVCCWGRDILPVGAASPGPELRRQHAVHCVSCAPEVGGQLGHLLVLGDFGVVLDGTGDAAAGVEWLLDPDPLRVGEAALVGRFGRHPVRPRVVLRPGEKVLHPGRMEVPLLLLLPRLRRLRQGGSRLGDLRRRVIYTRRGNGSGSPVVPLWLAPGLLGQAHDRGIDEGRQLALSPLRRRRERSVRIEP